MNELAIWSFAGLTFMSLLSLDLWWAVVRQAPEEKRNGLSVPALWEE